MIFFCVSGRNGVSSARELKRSGLHIPPPSRPKLQFGGIGVSAEELHFVNYYYKNQIYYY